MREAAEGAFKFRTAKHFPAAVGRGARVSRRDLVVGFEVGFEVGLSTHLVI